MSKRNNNGGLNPNVRMQTTKYSKRLILQSINAEPKKSLQPCDYQYLQYSNTIDTAAPNAYTGEKILRQRHNISSADYTHKIRNENRYKEEINDYAMMLGMQTASPQYENDSTKNQSLSGEPPALGNTFTNLNQRMGSQVSHQRHIKQNW